jgi:hypothetical protein
MSDEYKGLIAGIFVTVALALSILIGLRLAGLTVMCQ